MKKHVSAQGLLKRVRSQFEKIKEAATGRQRTSVSDCLMSGLAMFMLKMPSLLQFDKRSSEEPIKGNIERLYGVKHVPSDTYLRERLDEVVPSRLRTSFTRIFSALQRQKVLERYDYYNGHYLVSLDGTGCFSSHEIHCESCCVKNHQDGSKTYYHQMLAAVLVHPDEKTVIPLCPEPILKQDGSKKNDCELNASKRLLSSMRKEHPHLKMIIVEDSLYGKAPHINLLKELDMRYIIGVKPDDHKYLFEFVNAVKTDEKEITDSKGTRKKFRWKNKFPLNDSNPDCLVNFLEYTEISAKGSIKQFTWVTDIPLNEKTIYLVMKGGRARWKIENETFNTLKNLGYHFEHNFGHGYKYLSSVMAILMFLAFLIDQAQETCCDFFQRALKKAGAKRELWEAMRSIFGIFRLSSWEIFYRLTAREYGEGLDPTDYLKVNTS